MTTAQKIILTISILIYAFIAIFLTGNYLGERMSYNDCLNETHTVYYNSPPSSGQYRINKVLDKIFYLQDQKNSKDDCNRQFPSGNPEVFFVEILILTFVVALISFPLYKIWGRNKQHENKDQSS